MTDSAVDGPAGRLVLIEKNHVEAKLRGLHGGRNSGWPASDDSDVATQS